MSFFHLKLDSKIASLGRMPLGKKNRHELTNEIFNHKNSTIRLLIAIIQLLETFQIYVMLHCQIITIHSWHLTITFPNPSSFIGSASNFPN